MTKDSLSPGDPHSYSRPDKVKVIHIHLELDVDFKRKILHGHVELTLEKIDPKAKSVILDARNLTVSKVLLGGADNDKLVFEYNSSHSKIGDKLEVFLPSNGDKKPFINIFYSTSPTSPGLFWLTPKQTAGQKSPFMFSSSFAILARSIFPCQDSPSVKSPYTATITYPSDMGLTVLMSAPIFSGKSISNKPNKEEAKFTQQIPVPTYLIAIAVGDIKSQKIGPRSHVWGETSEIVADAAHQYRNTEKIIKHAETLLGKYVWTRYDILVMPPSYPWDSMENPTLTFVNPSYISRRNSTNVNEKHNNGGGLVHEIVHSWIGNLVTAATFEHFWLNEGITTFIERKLFDKTYGKGTRDLSSLIGWNQLMREEFTDKDIATSQALIDTKIKGDLISHEHF